MGRHAGRGGRHELDAHAAQYHRQSDGHRRSVSEQLVLEASDELIGGFSEPVFPVGRGVRLRGERVQGAIGHPDAENAAQVTTREPDDRGAFHHDAGAARRLEVEADALQELPGGATNQLVQYAIRFHRFRSGSAPQGGERQPPLPRESKNALYSSIWAACSTARPALNRESSAICGAMSASVSSSPSAFNE